MNGQAQVVGQLIADGNFKAAGLSELSGGVRLDNNNIYFRFATDTNNGLGYYNNTKTFAGDSALDGPVLFGNTGVYLGTKLGNSEHISLVCSSNGISVYGTFNNNSDRNAKQDFAPVAPAIMLEKVLQMPVSEWSYKVDSTTRHIGPMAQDFYSALGIGTDDKHIAPIDEGGVAFAAIQGLNQKVDAKDSEIETLKQQNESLQKRLTALEQAVQSLAERK